MSRLLVVVDMQKDFVDGALGSPEARAIVPNVLDKVKAYRDAGDEVVFTLDTHFDDYMDTMEGRKLPVVHCVKERRAGNWYRSSGKFREPVLRSIPLEAGSWLITQPWDGTTLWSWSACARISASYPTPC